MSGDIMDRAKRTVYRSLKQNFTQPELFIIFSPSEEEITWAKENARSLILCLLVNLKVFQHLGYFPAYDNIPEAIVAHVQNCLGAHDTVLKTYTDPKTLYRHRQLIRDSLHVIPWGKNASRIAVRKTAKLARIMENSIDLINLTFAVKSVKKGIKHCYARD
jgi:hypothetical protein